MDSEVAVAAVTAVEAGWSVELSDGYIRLVQPVEGGYFNVAGTGRLFNDLDEAAADVAKMRNANLVWKASQH